MELYGVIATILFYLTLPFFYVERVIHHKSFGWKEKFGNVEYQYSGEKTILIHACSVGEVNAIINLVKNLKENFADYKIVVTTGTKTGQDLAQKKFENIADFVTYFPFDIPSATNKFLERVNPSIAIIAETEIWPNFAYCCKKRDIPVIIVNGRISDSTYRTYKIAKLFFKQVFKSFDSVYTQSENDKGKYISIGMNADKTEFMGNLKFDIIAQNHNIDLGQQGFKILIAGSTHKGENEIIINTYTKLKQQNDKIKLLIAPRHLERVEEIKVLLDNTGLKYGFRSLDNKFIDNDVIILDTLGELGKMYEICDVAFIGGSFVNKGGHNPLEGAIYYKPTVSGPSTYNFKDIYSILTKENAGIVVESEDELEENLAKLFMDENFYNEISNNCENVFSKQRGAINFVVNKVRELLND